MVAQAINESILILGVILIVIIVASVIYIRSILNDIIDRLNCIDNKYTYISNASTRIENYNRYITNNIVDIIDKCEDILTITKKLNKASIFKDDDKVKNLSTKKNKCNTKLKTAKIEQSNKNCSNGICENKM